MYLDNKLVFLAGATGLAGSSIIEYIIQNYPTTEIRASYFRTEPFIVHNRVSYVQGDLRSKDDCRKMVRGCDCAIMAAAVTGGANLAKSQPFQMISDNLIMNANMLEAFYFENIKRIVYIGSATLYQEFDGNIKENELDLNKDPYPAYLGIGWVVRYIEKLCKFWHDKYGIEILIYRTANIFGPYAKFNPAVANFIPALITKAVERMDPFEVWGSPEVTRDVIYCEDFARAIVLLLDNNNIKFDIFNLGSGIRSKVKDVVEWILKCTDHKPSEIKYLSDKPTTIKFRALDIFKIKKDLEWEPRYTTEHGIAKTVEWWIKNRGVWTK